MADVAGTDNLMNPKATKPDSAVWMQATELKEMFEEVNGMKDCLQRCMTGMAGAFKKSQISRQLKTMGLKRNRLTDSQVSNSTQRCPAAPWLQLASIIHAFLTAKQ